MDILWQRQKHLFIILRTLPADCWIIVDQIYVSGNIFRSSDSLILLAFQNMTRTPTKKEWRRFKRYAARVVELFVGKTHGGTVSSETISFLGMQSILDPLWPRLTSLRLTGGLSLAVVPTLTLLSPKITSLALTIPQGSDILLQPMLSIASNRCHSLRELVLDVLVGDSASACVVGGLISASRDTLRTLEIKSLFKAEYLPFIADLPHLQSLKLRKASFPHYIPPNALPSLEEVTILRFQGQRLQDFFKRLCTTVLRVVNIGGTISATTFEELVAALSRFSASLTTLKVTNVSNLVLPNVVAPGLLFANLKYLHVGCLCVGEGTHAQCAFQPTDQTIAQLGAATPNIAHLTLGNPTCRALQCATFLSLVSLSKTCQNLETLDLKVDFQTMVTPSLPRSENVETGAASAGPQDNPCKLHTLAVGLSTLPDHSESRWIVAIGLGKIFPSLSKVVGHHDSDRHKWEEVRNNIGLLRQVLCTVQQ